eukprot:6187362-Pleurochrysis_carterae.AAC.4
MSGRVYTIQSVEEVFPVGLRVELATSVEAPASGIIRIQRQINRPFAQCRKHHAPRCSEATESFGGASATLLHSSPPPRRAGPPPRRAGGGMQPTSSLTSSIAG